MKHWTAIVLGLASMLLASTTHAQADSELRLGLAVPLSGDYAPLGRQLQQAAEFAAAERGVILVVADTEGTPEGAVKAVSALAKRPEIVAIFGPVGRRTSEAAAPVANRAGVPLFVVGTEASNRAGPWVFRFHLTPTEQAADLAELSADGLKHKKAAILFPESEFGRTAAIGFAKAFTAKGGSVTAVASYSPEETDFRKPLDVLVGKLVVLKPRAKLGKYKADGKGYARSRQRPNRDFDVLFIPDYHSRVSRLVAFLPSAGIQNGETNKGVGVQLLGLSSWRGKSMTLSGAKAAGALILDTFGGEAAGGRAEEFSRSFESKFGRRPTSLEAELFDAVWMVSTLAQSTATIPSRSDLVRRLPREETWEGVAGEIRFGPQGQPLRKQRLLRYDVDGALIPMD